MTIEELIISIKIDITDTDWIIKNRKEEFLNSNLSAGDYTNFHNASLGYRQALETILNRIEKK